MSELNVIRETIHKKSNELYAFRFERRAQKDWDKFYGCLDSLLDADTALHRIGKEDRVPTMLECYGFLIVLIMQQDAVEHLSDTVGLDFNSREIDALKKIRYLRDKIAAHSSWSNRRGKSSSIIDWASITKNGFKAIIYGGDRTDIGDNGNVYIDFEKFIMANDTVLIIQLKKVVTKMDDIETDFKSSYEDANLFSIFEKDTYLIQRLHCNLNDSSRIGQAIGHASILTNNLNSLVNHVSKKKVHEISKNSVKRCLHGLGLLVQILENTRKENFKPQNQWEFDIIFDGWEKSYQSLRQSVEDFELSLNI